MSQTSPSLTPALDPLAVGIPAAGRLSRTTAQRLVALAVVPMVAVTVVLALTSDHLQRPVAAALYWGYLVAAPMLIGLYWWTRRPASRFGRLLIAFGAVTWVVTWQAADVPLISNLGVLAEAPFFLLTIYLFLAFPLGRVEPRAARWLMGALCGAALVTFYPWALSSPVLGGGGPLARCAPACPENVLQIGTSPELAEVAGKAETYLALTLVACVFAVYLWRLVSASRPQRRALTAVAVTSLLFLPAYFVTNFTAWVLEVTDLQLLDTMAWFIVATRILMPLGFLVALVQAELFASRALRTLLENLAARPTPERWRDMIAEALDDRRLRLGFHDPGTGTFREPSGDVLARAGTPAHRAFVPVERNGHAVAAMEIDDALTADPELVGAAAGATLLAVENGALEGELQASRARILEAGDAARRRIERDLHDSAQQRLVALRVHLALIGERLDDAQERETIERLGGEVEQAIDELRDVARGLYPQVLGQLGPGAALETVARRSAPSGARAPRRARPPPGADRDHDLLLLRRVPAERGQARRAGGDGRRPAAAAERPRALRGRATTARASIRRPRTAAPGSRTSPTAWPRSAARSRSGPRRVAGRASPGASPPPEPARRLRPARRRRPAPSPRGGRASARRA